MQNIDTMTKEELEKHYEYLMRLWSKYSCDCLGFEITAVQNKIQMLN